MSKQIGSVGFPNGLWLISGKFPTCDSISHFVDPIVLENPDILHHLQPVYATPPVFSFWCRSRVLLLTNKNGKLFLNHLKIPNQ